MRRGRWAFGTPRPPPASLKRDKPLIEAVCQRFIEEALKPRFLPEIRPTEFNYPVDIRGRWHGANFRFIQRYRLPPPNPDNKEFDAPFARLEYHGPDRFGLSWYRHTGQWWPLRQNLTLAQALAVIQETELLWPN